MRELVSYKPKKNILVIFSVESQLIIIITSYFIGGFCKLLGGSVDPRHCFGCGDVVKHPVDESLYEAGHYLVENCFFHRYIEVLPATQPGDIQD